MSEAGMPAAVPPANEPANEPDGAPRIATLDILRGIAILAILFMNISEMGASMTANWSDLHHLGWSASDQIVWWLRTILIEGTPRAMLQMLFGAGMLILTDRIDARSSDPLSVPLRYGWRNLVLWAFGMAHMMLLLWPGDILHSYAVAAMVACLFRGLPPRALLVLGLSYATFTMALGLSTVSHRLADPTAASASATRTAAADDAAVAREDAFGHGTMAQWTAGQRAVSMDRLRNEEVVIVWEAAATMLIGAALFRWGVLQGAWSRRRYGWLLAVGYGMGVPLRLYGGWEATRLGGGFDVAWLWEDFARLAMTMGHLAAVMLAVQGARGRRLLQPFVAAGRTALTLYVAQTLIVSWLIFSPIGLGLYGRLDWTAMMAVALAVNALLLWGANVYVCHFRIAPVEWAWRSIVERRMLPLR
ncbi:DUF418 domain-containing protein [Sphingomonas sp. DC1100-1]|uniref:DUF418 domain-containing protein n=1 Tax=unclassified Sphingomonas TaxID=196159 RepID=UPI003CED5105